ncbi:LLM class F420-dependent oxidoreductase [Streptacidiphilus sp. N1-12]|uniref:LLM class F420-dependent oxidoreductase n=2 Tax=Streptacidiphilus alkalitolerans TaxID=3342712 RepID=A0ABV6X233_9ACTN
MSLGRFGIWSSALQVKGSSADGEVLAATQELEKLGYGAVWIGGSSSVRHAAALIAATDSLTVATGILSIWDEEAADVAAQTAELAAAHPGRFLLGLGASHALLAGDRYQRPYSAMVAYLDALDAAPVPVPAEARVLAALGPKMLRLSGERTAGAHPYLVTVEHTAEARAALGPGPLLAPEVKVVLDADPERARSTGRDYLARYLQLPNYTGNLLRLGFSEQDFADGGSDRLVDALFAWGDADAVRARAEEFLAAGADHLALQLVTGGDQPGLPRDGWRRLAELLELGRP